VTVKLRRSHTDGRARDAGYPYALIERDSNNLVSLHSCRPDCVRAQILLEQVSSSSRAWGFGAAELLAVAVSVCERMFPGRAYDQLFGVDQDKLIRAIQTELRSRR
jgi:hypothetical protein